MFAVLPCLKVSIKIKAINLMLTFLLQVSGPSWSGNAMAGILVTEGLLCKADVWNVSSFFQMIKELRFKTLIIYIDPMKQIQIVCM